MIVSLALAAVMAADCHVFVAVEASFLTMGEEGIESCRRLKEAL